MDLLRSAGESDDAFASMRSFVYDYYWAEQDYELRPQQLEGVFAVLAAYLESEAAFGDSERARRLTRAAEALQLECSAEAAVAGLRCDDVEQLLVDAAEKKLSEHVLWRKTKALTPVKVDTRRVLRLVQQLRELRPEYRETS